MPLSNSTITRVRPALLLTFGFVAFLLTGISVVADYAIPMDEPSISEFGKQTYEYLTGVTGVPDSYDWKTHGPLIEVGMYALLELIPKEVPFIFSVLLRHILNFAMFAGTVAALFCIARRSTKNLLLAAVPSLLLVFTPRLFAHGFVNTRDIGAMFFATLSALTMLRFVEKKTIANAALHGLTCALFVAVRIPGLIMPAITVLLLLIDSLKTKNWKLKTFPSAIYIFSWIAFTLLLWPLLWHDPAGNLREAMRLLGSVPGGGFYWGSVQSPPPWHYVPVWMLITIPMPVTVLFLLGLVRLGAKSTETLRQPVHALALCWLLLPLGAIFTLGGGVFDEWRHLFFLYPAFLLIAGEGTCALLTLLKKHSIHAARIVAGVLAVHCLWIGAWMIRNHPLQHLYFSVPAAWVDGKFELDYWGLTSLTALDWIAASDPRMQIYIHGTHNMTLVNGSAFFDRNPQFITVDDDEADYIVDTFRRDAYRKIYDGREKLFSIAVDGIEAAAVYRGDGYPREEALP